MEPFLNHSHTQSPEVTQAQQNMDYMNTYPRRKHGKTYTAGVPAFAAGALQSNGSSELPGISNLVLKLAFKMNLSRLQKPLESLKVHASTAENESQASLSSPQPPQV